MFLFKLNPVGFYLLLVQQVFYVYCQFHILLYYYVIWISKLYNSRTHTTLHQRVFFQFWSKIFAELIENTENFYYICISHGNEYFYVTY